LGRYTANAIACFSTHKSLPIIEANTRRLWSRVLGRAGDPTKPPLANDLWQLAEAALPSRSPADFNQSAMDIGSTICTPTRPACDRCPLVRFCRSFRDGTVGQIPTRVAKRAVVLRTDVSVVVWDHPRRRLLVTQRAPEGQWGGLWEFPRIECRNDETLEEAVPKALRCATTQPARILGTGPIIRHSIMHYRVTLHVVEVQITSTRQQRTSTPRRWISVNELLSLPWSTPQRKIARWLSQRESSNATTP
jgi:A/G-specific adenine glycosylase